MKQLEESGKREARLLKQLETQQGQIGQVIHSKFETVHISGERPQSDISSPLPLESLIDVDKHDDEAFLKNMEAMTQ
jgi:hypothetical protein